MHRAKIFLAITAYVTLYERLFSRPLVIFLRKIERKFKLLAAFHINNSPGITDRLSNSFLFYSPLGLGLIGGYLVRFLRI